MQRIKLIACTMCTCVNGLNGRHDTSLALPIQPVPVRGETVLNGMTILRL